MNQNVNWMENKVLNTNASGPARTPSVGVVARRAPAEAAAVVPAGEETGQNLNFGSVGTGGMPRPNVMTEQGPPPATDRYYIPGYLATLIGKRIRAEFLIGSNFMVDRVGILREVGVNYFILEDEISGSNVMCDLYSVKFVTSPVR